MEGVEDLILLVYEILQLFGMDLWFNIDLDLKFGQIVLILIGIKVVLLEGMEGQVRLCFGLVVKYLIMVLNVLGIVDVDYCGEIKVILYNVGIEFFVVEWGDCIV